MKTTAANRGDSNEDQRGNYTPDKTQQQGHPNSAQTQRQQILAWLYIGTLTTLQARKELDIKHPAARVKELREQGYNIVTHWTTESTGKGKHHIACYVLLVGGNHD